MVRRRNYIDFVMLETAHRPWPLPSMPWSLHQRWHDLLFAHWPVPTNEMRKLLPPNLDVDTYDGTAWVGIVPFRMSAVRPRGLPVVPWLSSFPELNVRTYVRARPPAPPQPGVYFFSLDAANPVAVTIARAVYRLPYYRARMQLTDDGTNVTYRSTRTHPKAAAADFSARYGPASEIYHAVPGTLEHWLTERYCLYTVGRQHRVYQAQIHHSPWPLQKAHGSFGDNTVAAASGITLPECDPILHFARRLDVVAWPLRRVVGV